MCQCVKSGCVFNIIDLVSRCYKNATEADDSVSVSMSGYCDSNTGPSGPKPDALANCATPRNSSSFELDCKYTKFFPICKIFQENYRKLPKITKATHMAFSFIQYFMEESKQKTGEPDFRHRNRTTSEGYA